MFQTTNQLLIYIYGNYTSMYEFIRIIQTVDDLLGLAAWPWAMSGHGPLSDVFCRPPLGSVIPSLGGQNGMNDRVCGLKKV